MKRIIILAISLLTFTISHANDKPKKHTKPRVVKIIPQGSNDGVRMYAVVLSDGRTFDYMYMEEIKEAKRTGVWAYNEMLEYNKK